jgi:hypothetical protein
MKILWQEESTRLFTPVIRTLQWRRTLLSKTEHEGHLNSVRNSYLRELKLANGLPEGSRNAVVSRLRKLSSASQRRLFSAPELFRTLTHSVRNGGSRLLSFIETSLDAEECLEKQKAPRHPVWSARGDWYFPAGFSADGLPRRANTMWKSDEVFRAPMLDEMIAVDYQSPHARAAFYPNLPRFVAFDPDEVAIVLAKLSRAMRSVRSVSNEAYGFIVTFLNHIVLRKTKSASRCASFSTNECIGRAGLMNPQSENYDWVTLANDLLHEATHHFQYILDRRRSLLPEPAAARRVPMVSPWTGNSISLYSFVSACFVWFGLVHFWKRALECDVFPQKRVRDALVLSLAGFLGDDLAGLVESAGWRGAPANTIIRAMQTTIRRI